MSTVKVFLLVFGIGNLIQEGFQNVAQGVLSGVVKVSGLIASSVATSKMGKQFFSMLPGEVILISVDGFVGVFDAFEMAGKNVLITSSDVTTDVVSHRYGEQAAGSTKERLGAADHMIGTAWTVAKIGKLLIQECCGSKDLSKDYC